MDARAVDFRDLLKAKLLGTTPPLQLIRSSTWDPSRAKLQKGGRKRGAPRQMQDEATRAWNIHTWRLLQGRGTPWRLMRASTNMSTLFVGVSFFHTPGTRPRSYIRRASIQRTRRRRGCSRWTTRLDVRKPVSRHHRPCRAHPLRGSPQPRRAAAGRRGAGGVRALSLGGVIRRPGSAWSPCRHPTWGS